MAGYQATFRFYSGLTDLLANSVDSGRVVRRFDHSPSVKDQIEACGIPHTEVDLILANGASVGFDYRLGDGDRISVYPAFSSIDIASVTRVRPDLPQEIRFVADVNVSKLGRYLRLLGLDTVVAGNTDDADLVDVAVSQHRILLSKDRPLLKRGAVINGYLVRGVTPDTQLIEVVRRFDLGAIIEPFARCMECNGVVERIEKAVIEHRLEPLTKRYFDEFRRCPDCDRIFWRGSHFERLEALVDRVRAQSG